MSIMNREINMQQYQLTGHCITYHNVANDIQKGQEDQKDDFDSDDNYDSEGVERRKLRDHHGEELVYGRLAGRRWKHTSDALVERRNSSIVQ